MRYLFTLLLTSSLCVATAFAEQQKEVQITVLDRKDKPLLSNTFVHTNRSMFYRELTSTGTIRFSLSAEDTIFVVSGKNYAIVPVEGRDQITVYFEKSKAYDKNDASREYAMGKLPKFKPGKINETENIAAYGNLIMLIKTKFPAILLRKERGTMHAFLSNSSSAAAPPSSGPYIAAAGVDDGNAVGAASIFIDGKPCPSIEEANRIVDITTLKTITIEKPDIARGKGGNGIIRIISIYYTQAEEQTLRWGPEGNKSQLSPF